MTAAPGFTDAFAIRRIETGGTAMRVAQIGGGPDIVWVPGGDSPAEAWVLQMTAFSDRFRSTSYDPRGVGQTVSAPGPWTIADFARDCAGLIEQVCRPPVILTDAPSARQSGTWAVTICLTDRQTDGKFNDVTR